MSVDNSGIVVKVYTIEAIETAEELIGYFCLISVPTFVLSLLPIRESI